MWHKYDTVCASPITWVMEDIWCGKAPVPLFRRARDGEAQHFSLGTLEEVRYAALRVPPLPIHKVSEGLRAKISVIQHQSVLIIYELASSVLQASRIGTLGTIPVSLQADRKVKQVHSLPQSSRNTSSTCLTPPVKEITTTVTRHISSFGL